MYKAGEFEHNPIVDASYTRGKVTNRARTQLRMTSGGNVWRGRNKLTVRIKQGYVAYEGFYENGRWFRSRYITGIGIVHGLDLFTLYQETRGDKIRVLGISATVWGWE